MGWTLTDNFKGRFNRIGHKGKKGKNHPCWKGGKIVDKDGYIRIWKPDHQWPRKGYMMEHVFVVELSIGRKITTKETVHHLDGNRQNNTIENLVLMNRSEHSKLHRSIDSVRFVRGCNGRYVKKCGHS